MKDNELLQQAIERHGLPKVASALDVSKSVVSRWARGLSPFPVEHALYLAEWMGEPEPNHYELLAAATRHESRKKWLQKKARAVAGCSVVLLALGFVSPTLEARGYQEVNYISTVYIMRSVRRKLAFLTTVKARLRAWITNQTFGRGLQQVSASV